MVTDDNDFSFPIIVTKPVSNFTIPSTSLWRISSLVYPDCYGEGEDDHDHDQKGSSRSEGSSSSPISEFSSRKSSSDDVDAEERMDMLWEDLNEETTKMVSWSCSSRLDNTNNTDIDHERGSRTSTRSATASEYFDDCIYDLDGVGASGEMEMEMVMVMKEDKEEEELSRENALKISNKTRVLKRPSMVVVLRALKKLFFLHNLARTRN